MNRERRDSLISESTLSETEDLIEKAVLPSQKGPLKPRSGSVYLAVSLSIAAVICASVFLGIFSQIQFSSPRTFSPQKCASPSVRREWRTLTTSEKKEYTDAVRCLFEQPSILNLELNQSLYDDFPYIHIRSGDPTHDTISFLPWHRYFLHVFETKLRQHCKFRGQIPYWDWTLDWQDVRRAPVWGADGFGGDGNISLSGSIGRGHCVTNGPFAMVELKNANHTRYPHCLSRGFPSDEEIAKWAHNIEPKNVAKVLRLGNYRKFFLELEHGPHMTIPFSVRGDFFYFTAPNDPIFFLHHAQLDRLWHRWQNEFADPDQAQWCKRDQLAASEELSSSLDVGGLARSASIGDVIDTQGPLLCYIYA